MLLLPLMKQSSFTLFEKKKRGKTRAYQLKVLVIVGKGRTFQTVAWTLVQLKPRLITEIVLFVSSVCTCSSKSVTKLIKCTLGNDRLDSSLTVETKVEGHVVRAATPIEAFCHWMYLVLKVRSLNKTGFFWSNMC